MKTASMDWPIGTSKQPSQKDFALKDREVTLEGKKAAIGAAINTAHFQMVRASAATLVVLSILVGAIWGSEYLASSGIVEAMIWASGFVFLGLALESNTVYFKSLLATGLALPILAMLSSQQAIEFTIIAAALIAAWAGFAVLQGWKEE